LPAKLASVAREGWALDFRKYSTDYLQAEAEARRTGAGIWRGEFEPPWEWRAHRQGPLNTRTRPR
jgi:endonuclease YncB( thermonuclease family)